MNFFKRLYYCVLGDCISHELYRSRPINALQTYKELFY